MGTVIEKLRNGLVSVPPLIMAPAPSTDFGARIAPVITQI